MLNQGNVHVDSPGTIGYNYYYDYQKAGVSHQVVEVIRTSASNIQEEYGDDFA